MIRSRTTTLLIGFDPRTALAVARSLHRNGVRVVVATLADWETPVRSRAVAAYILLPRADRGAKDFLRALLDTIERHGVDTLIPLTDRALVALTPHEESLRARIRYLGPTQHQAGVVLDKSATGRLASSLGIPVPKTLIADHAEDIEEMGRRLKFPVFVKPQSKVFSCLTESVPAPDVFCCRDLPALRARLPGLVSDGTMKILIQERAPGDDVGVAVVMRRGQAVSTFQYRALRTWPIDGGVCVAGRSEVVHPGMVDCAVRFLRALSWEGVAQFDFRHDRESGDFALLEVNGRFWGSTAASIAAGHDLPWMVWRLARDEPVEATPARSRVQVRWFEGDLRRLLELARPTNGLAAWARFARELLPFLWDFRPSVQGMYWSWRDPVPGLQCAVTFSRWWCAARLKQSLQKVNGPTRIPTHAAAPGLLVRPSV